MKNITKDNRGITLVALILTVIIMLILTSVIVYTGLDTYKFSKVNAFVTEMQLIQSKVDEKTMNELLEIGTEVSSTTPINLAFANKEISSDETSEYKYFTKETLINEFDIEDVSSDVMINITTREVVSARGVEYNGNKYYTQYKLPGGQTIINENIQTNRDLSFNLNTTIDGLNATITISDIKITNGTLSYKEENDEYWQSVTNYTEANKEYVINISRAGNYIFKLQDNTDIEKNEENNIKIVLTNKPKTSINIDSYNYGEKFKSWAFAEKDNINYVWIPRFVYKTNSQGDITEIKFMKGNSNISTENTYMDYTWNTHKKLTFDDAELTGIWVSLEGVNQENLYNEDLIDIINYIIELLDNDKERLIEI